MINSSVQNGSVPSSKGIFLLRSVYHQETGQSLILFSISLLIILGMLGMVLDYSLAVVRQRQMQTAADAAALAGARDLANGESESRAIARMESILVANQADADLSTYTVSNGSVTDVRARISVPTSLSRLLGVDQIAVEAHSQAAAGQLTESDHLMPFAVPEGEWVLDQPVTLWGGKNGPGNFGWVRWEGQSPSTTTLRMNISDPGRSDTVTKGGRVNGHPGVSFNPVQGDLDAWIGETITVFLYDPDETEGSGNNLTYKATGFANFVITGTSSHGNSSEINGVFVSYVKFGAAIEPGVMTGAQGVGLLQ